ncbi:MAG: hypothetical protein ACOYNJ_02420 [Candidatus Nanopelagicales bacterium]
MRRFLALPALAGVGLALSAAALGLAPAHAGGAGTDRAPSTSQPRTPAPQVTFMGDSHVVVMINDMFPGEYSSGAEGTIVGGRFHTFAINGIKLRQVMRGRGVVKAGVSVVGTTNVTKWRQAIRRGPDTIVVNLGTNDGGPSAADIDKFMRLAGKDRRVFWVKPYYTSCPACRAIHDFQLDAAAQRHANLRLVKVNDLGLTLAPDGLHAYGRTNSRAIWNRIQDTITSVETVPPQLRTRVASAA